MLVCKQEDHSISHKQANTRFFWILLVHCIASIYHNENAVRISAFKTWLKNPKNRKLKLCLLFGLNVFFNVLTFIRINYQCSKLNTYLDTIFPSEWGYCVYIEIPLRLSPAPTFGALKNERSDVTFLMYACEYRMTWSIYPLNTKL